MYKRDTRIFRVDSEIFVNDLFPETDTETTRFLGTKCKKPLKWLFSSCNNGSIPDRSHVIFIGAHSENDLLVYQICITVYFSRLYYITLLVLVFFFFFFSSSSSSNLIQTSLPDISGLCVRSRWYLVYFIFFFLSV